MAFFKTISQKANIALVDQRNGQKSEMIRDLFRLSTWADIMMMCFIIFRT